MNEIKEYTEKLFENIKHIDENGNEYWLARELMPLLEYNKWERFSNAIEYAKTSCIKSGYNVSDHFPEVGKLVQIGSKTNRKLKDYKLSRYACYLIVQNGDSRKEAIALGQTYFAIQTRRQEVADYFNQLDEDNKRLVIRGDIKQWNQMLLEVAHNSGVITNQAVGTTVRKAIKDIGGTMPEDLPTPEKSIKQVEKEQLKRLKDKKTKLMLDE